jgi:hypothetical protein
MTDVGSWLTFLTKTKLVQEQTSVITVSYYSAISLLTRHSLVENVRQNWLGQESTSVITVSNYTWQPEHLSRIESGRFGTLKSDSTHHFLKNACTKSRSLRFSVFRLLTDFSLSLYIFTIWKCIVYHRLCREKWCGRSWICGLFNFYLGRI